jgi:hypothetical protein
MSLSSSENLPRASQKPWLQFLEVPLEIWAEVAALSGRQSIARLSAVSHAFYSIFSTILYGDMTVTARALTWQQAQLLIRTLCEHSHSPTQSIRTLCLPGMGYYRAIDMSQCLGALRGLLDTAPLKAAKFSKEIRVVRGAALRTLKWDSEMGANELSCLLLTPGYFPNLKELSVACGVDSLAQEKEPTQFDVRLLFPCRFIRY